ncbi:hypothetical protein ZIOFF_006498 [Zingiber officinale]|uniref:WRKY domain-containing protein n=1 Tax=Zingiber officinale TaxID=94328 RepID=A0A8J5M550_ZINOF|nr:hypothetical protein ZIOFF_006498 [Zingiber officinale]
MDDNNWDLHAVVRAASSFAEEEEDVVQVSNDQLFSVFHELQDLCKPTEFHLQQQAPPLDLSLTAPLLPARRQQSRGAHLSKRRKNPVKKVSCQVPANGVHPDRWAWRKYGQKPIKGSPYPRCSSSKACEAKKQVERSRADPEMLHITYTAEHNHPVPTHRNSLAGTTRQKPIGAVQAPAGGDLNFLTERGISFEDHLLTCSDVAAPVWAAVSITHDFQQQGCSDRKLTVECNGIGFGINRIELLRKFRFCRGY